MSVSTLVSVSKLQIIYVRQEGPKFHEMKINYELITDVQEISDSWGSDFAIISSSTDRSHAPNHKAQRAEKKKNSLNNVEHDQPFFMVAPDSAISKSGGSFPGPRDVHISSWSICQQTHFVCWWFSITARRQTSSHHHGQRPWSFPNLNMTISPLVHQITNHLHSQVTYAKLWKEWSIPD